MMIVWAGIALILAVGFTVFFGAPYVPSKRRDVEAALTRLYPLASHDTLVDIGSGDGVVLRIAAEKGAHAIGYELSPLLFIVSRLLSLRNHRVEVHLANYWYVDFPRDTSVVYTFGDGRDITRMKDKVAEQATRLGKELVFISYGFEVPELTPVKSSKLHHLYIVRPLHGENHKYNKDHETA